MTMENRIRQARPHVTRNEALIFERNGGQYVPHDRWNSETMDLLRRFHAGVQEKVRPRLQDWRDPHCSDFQFGVPSARSEQYAEVPLPGQNSRLVLRFFQSPPWEP